MHVVFAKCNFMLLWIQFHFIFSPESFQTQNFNLIFYDIPSGKITVLFYVAGFLVIFKLDIKFVRNKFKKFINLYWTWKYEVYYKKKRNSSQDKLFLHKELFMKMNCSENFKIVVIKLENS
jgi:hypothetical protein